MGVRNIDLSLADEETLGEVVQALNTKTRRDIMRMLYSASFSVAEIAKQLKLPVSTVSFHLNILRKAGFITVTVKHNTRGNAKLVSRKVDNVNINFLQDFEKRPSSQEIMEIPLGSYTEAKVSGNCGMASESGIIVGDDMSGAFFSPLRSQAQIIWFSKGFIEYRVPNYLLKDKKVNSVLFSAELCSEAPNYRNDWKSDISFWINGVEVATWLSPGDFGGRRGRLNPVWWSDYSTQYGMIKTLRVTDECVYLDETPVSTYNIKKLKLAEGDYITLRIGVKEDAKHQGGMNIFGEKFGDFSQGLIYMVDYN